MLCLKKGIRKDKKCFWALEFESSKINHRKCISRYTNYRLIRRREGCKEIKSCVEHRITKVKVNRVCLIVIS